MAVKKETALKEPAIAEQSFEEGLTGLEGLVAKLEQGELSLEESLSVYEQGVRLTALLNNRLKTAKMKIEELKQPSNENNDH